MKSCRKSGTLFTLPCKCQWLCDMKAFRQKHEEKCKTLDLPELSTRSEEFCTGSTYEGEWRKGCGMHGYGVYSFVNGVVYEGEFRDGTMHGTGELRYKTHYGTAAVRGQWKNGKMTESTIIFDDALDYDDEDWQYCKMPDRRFAVEYAEGLMPGGRSNQTPNKPILKVPVGYYDTEDGFYDCTRKVVFKHDDAAKLIRGPSTRERKWIVENCRVGEEGMHVGPRQDLYEKYVEPTEYLEPPPAPSIYTRFKLNSEFGEVEIPFERELHKTIKNVKANTVAAVPTELLLN